MPKRKLNLAHFAFYRGWLEGLDLADLGERYLITGRDRWIFLNKQDNMNIVIDNYLVYSSKPKVVNHVDE